MATIVVVEDQPDNLKLITALLTMKGHRVVGLTSGEPLVATLLAEQPPPRLVLLDIQLPGRDGYSVLADVKRDRKSTRLNSSHLVISYAVFCLKKKKKLQNGSDRPQRQRQDKHRQILYCLPARSPERAEPRAAGNLPDVPADRAAHLLPRQLAH